MVDMRHGVPLQTPINFAVFGLKHKLWVFVFLELAEHFEAKFEQIWQIFLFCNKTALCKTDIYIKFYVTKWFG